MLSKTQKLNIKLLSNAIVDLTKKNNYNTKKTIELEIKLNSVLANQELLFCLVKRLADCFQLEYIDGKYISKRKEPKKVKQKIE